MVGLMKPTGSLWTRSAALLGLLGFLELAPQAALAAPIRHASRHEMRTVHSWSRYLLARPSVWRSTHAPAFTPAIRRMIWRQVRTSDVTAAPMINYLMWRRSLRPERFDRYHPRLGPTLAQLLNQPVAPVVPQAMVPTPLTPAPTPSPGPSAPQTIEPSVPEPSTWLLALLMGAWGLWSRRRLRTALAP